MDTYTNAGKGASQTSNNEYQALLEFIRAQKQASGEAEAGLDTFVVKKRYWMTPWKVREVSVTKDGKEEEMITKVPPSW
jgi:H+-transporting ATPase